MIGLETNDKMDSEEYYTQNINSHLNSDHFCTIFNVKFISAMRWVRIDLPLAILAC